MGRAFRGLLWLGGSHLVQLAFGVVSSVLLARLLSPRDMGGYALVVASASLLYAIPLSWTQAPLVRFGKEWRETRGGWRPVWLRRLPMVGAGALAVLLLLATPLREWWTRLAFGGREAAGFVVALGVVTLWLQAEAGTLMQVEEDYRRLALAQAWAKALWAGALAALLLLWRDAGYSAVAAAFFITTLAAWLVMLLPMLRASGAGAGPSTAGPPVAAMLRHGWPVIPAALVGYLSNWGDHWLLNFFLGKEALGSFALAYQVFLVILGLTSPFAQVFLPVILRGGGGERDRQLVRGLFPFALAVWLLFVVALGAVLPELFRWMYPRAYGDGSLVLSILMGGAVVTLLTNLYGPFFSLQSRLWLSAGMHALMTGANIALSLLLIPRLGMKGAAIGTAASYWVAAYGYALVQQRILGVRERAQLALPLAALGAVALFVLFHDQAGVRFAVALAAAGLIVAAARAGRWASSPLVSDTLRDSGLPWLEKAVRRVFVG